MHPGGGVGIKNQAKTTVPTAENFLPFLGGVHLQRGGCSVPYTVCAAHWAEARAIPPQSSNKCDRQEVLTRLLSGSHDV